MTYKLLVEKGIAFVCLDDGTRLPYQIQTVATQMLRYTPMVTVTMYVYTDKPDFDAEMVRYMPKENHGLFFLGNRLEGVHGLEILPRIEDRPLVAKFTVECAFGDTKEAPININQPANT